MKRFTLTVIFTCVLSVSVLAGEIPTCGIVTSPPPPTSGTTQSIEDTTDTTTDLLTSVVLEIITWP